MYQAVITKVTNIRSHPNADRLNIADVLGYQIIIGKDVEEDTLGVFFSDDGCLSHEMCYENSLYSHSQLNKDKEKKGFFDNKGRVRITKLRGEKSYGFWVELSALDWTGIDTNILTEGYSFSALNGKEVCHKLVSKATKQKSAQYHKQSKKKSNKLFLQHKDTLQLRKEAKHIQKDSILWFTLKMHGTSGRTGHLPIEQTKKLPTWKKLLHYVFKVTEPTEYAIVTGTRRVELNFDTEQKGFYKTNVFRKIIHDDIVRKKLPKGITLYYEIVGYTENGKPIQLQRTERIADKKDKKKFETLYGKEIHYSYATDNTTDTVEDKFAYYVYRATFTNKDGFTEDLSWQATKKLCGSMGLNCVLEVLPPYIYDGNSRKLIDKITPFLEGSDLIDPRHPIEGIVIREESDIATKFYKEKSWDFKLLEFGTKQTDVVDMEEVEEMR